jgi:hypothetical protein
MVCVLRMSQSSAHHQEMQTLQPLHGRFVAPHMPSLRLFEGLVNLMQFEMPHCCLSDADPPLQRPHVAVVAAGCAVNVPEVRVARGAFGKALGAMGLQSNLRVERLMHEGTWEAVAVVAYGVTDEVMASLVRFVTSLLFVYVSYSNMRKECNLLGIHQTCGVQARGYDRL